MYHFDLPTTVSNVRLTKSQIDCSTAGAILAKYMRHLVCLMYITSAYSILGVSARHCFIDQYPPLRSLVVLVDTRHTLLSDAALYTAHLLTLKSQLQVIGLSLKSHIANLV